MQCPHCQGYSLEAQEFTPGLLAAECKRCHGTLVSLLYYRHWLEQQSQSLPPAREVSAINQKSEPAACLCPKCQRFMAKFQLSATTNHKLDLCAACKELWLDQGEWQLLLKLDLHRQLSDMFTLGWQNNIKRERHQQFTDSHYRKILGDTDFGQTQKFKEWLNQHSERDQIKQYAISR